MALYPNPCFHQIELDLNRGTISERELTEGATEQQIMMSMPSMLEQVRRILVAYTKRNPLVGYTQGLNFVLGRLILQLTEEEAFWVFTMLLERILPFDYYNQMMGANADCHYFAEELLKEVLPSINKHFAKLKFKPTFFSFNWFVCLFQDKLSDKLSLAILDLIFVYGSHMIHVIALAILYQLKELILATTDFSK
jgi:hypothetical protein